MDEGRKGGREGRREEEEEGLNGKRGVKEGGRGKGTNAYMIT